MYTKNIRLISITFAVIAVMFACPISKAVLSHGVDLSEYSYVIFGQESTGDQELDDVILTV